MAKSDIEALFQDALHRLREVNRRYFLLRVLRYFLQLLIVNLLLFLGFVVLEILFELSSPMRVSFWIFSSAITGYYFFRFMGPDLRKAFWPAESEFTAIARQIGKQDTSVRDALIDFWQIYHGRGVVAHGAFKTLSLKQLYEKFKNSNFHCIISLQFLKIPARRLSLILTIILFSFFVLPGPMNQAMLKVLNPYHSYEKPLPITLVNLSGDLQVLKNNPVELKGTYRGIAPHRIWLVIQRGTGEAETIERLEIPLLSRKQFAHSFNHVKEAFRYWFEASVVMAPFKNHPVYSEIGMVRVRERPYIRNLQVKIEYPRYTGLPVELLPPDNGEITALKGSQITLHVEVNKKLLEAWLLFQDSTRIPLKVVENRARGGFKLLRDTRYQIVVLDVDSIPNYRPVEYTITTLTDEVPFVEIAKPGQDLDLGDELRVPLLINLRDDYGFSSLALKGQVIREGSTGDTVAFSMKLPIHTLEKNRAISEGVWDLTPFYLVPEDYVEYFAEVGDNDFISGPKFSRSRVFVLRLASLIDLLEQTGQDLMENLEGTEDLTEETKKLKEKLEEINREMKRENKLTWERKKELQEQLATQQKNLEKLQNIQQRLEEVINQLDDQNLLSAETLEKYFELQKMFQELASTELLDAMRKLQEALEEVDLNQIRKALQEFKFSLEQFERNIQRTYELFKQVLLEQKMDELVKMAEKIAEEQKNINKQLEKEPLHHSEREQLKNKEGNLQKQSEFLKEKIEATQRLFQELLAKHSNDLQKAADYMEAQGMVQQMQNMQQQLGNNRIQQARQEGKEIEHQMQMLQTMLQQAQQNMLQEQKQEIMQAMQKVTQSMLDASFQQENLIQQSRRSDMASPQIPDIARKQAQLRENVFSIIQQLINLSQKTFFISPQMNQIMASLLRNIDKSLQNLENRNPHAASQTQKKAMANLNQGILSLQSSMQQLSQASSGTGFEEFLKRLQQMAGQQGQLNQQGLSLFQQQAQGRLQLSEEDLARLAAQQEMIRRSLEQLSKQVGNRGDVLGRLDQIGKEMEEVVKELKKQRLDRRVIERQQRILSRLLDAQKSIREREYSKKRKAERERGVVVKSPPELKREILERENRLRKELLEALQQGYSTEYKDFIKLYYEILSRHSTGQH